MDKAKEVLIDWLNNAHAMEHSVTATLEAHAEDAKDMPEVRQDLLDHTEHSKEHARRVKAEIERLGGEVSEIKTGLGIFGGWAAGVAAGLTDDKIVKNAVAEHAAEHYEMATYIAIAKMAELAGEDETAVVAREIMSEEAKAGKMTGEDVESAVEQYLSEKLGK